MTSPNIKKIICIAFLALIFVSSVVSATEITIQMQNLGLTNQDFVVFDENGTIVFSGNLTNAVTLNTSNSSFWTMQFQPSVSTIEPNTILDTFFELLQKYWVIMFLLVIVLIVITKRR